MHFTAIFVQFVNPSHMTCDVIVRWLLFVICSAVSFIADLESYKAC